MLSPCIPNEKILAYHVCRALSFIHSLLVVIFVVVVVVVVFILHHYWDFFWPAFPLLYFMAA